MGCDIHLYLEKKNNQGVWEHYPIPLEDLPDNRNYQVFALLAGVRGRVKKTYFARRGIPEDTSYRDPLLNESLVEDDIPYLGEHSFTFASIKELKKVKWDEAEFSDQWPLFLEKHFPDSENDDVRMLIGFDS